MIDSTLFGADLPAGTYTKGDKIQLKCVSGPANVRSGRGAAILKNITSGMLGSIAGSVTLWRISVKNSDWIDTADNFTAVINAATALDVRSGCNNFGHDCDLTPNSNWVVEAECLFTITTTIANSIFALIDVDYPQVSSIINPAKLKGNPTAIVHDSTTETANAAGSLTTAAWSVRNVDVFKAGYKYALDKVENITDGATVGFLSICNAAGMAGLARIIPIVSNAEAIKQTIDYASVLVKGPMDIKTMYFDNNTGAGFSIPAAYMILDYVKVRV